MEALGGVGYLDSSENEAINIARLYRDCCVNSIWEGTTDVLATDSLRVLKGRGGGDVLTALDRWVVKALSSLKTSNPTCVAAKDSLFQDWESAKASIIDGTSENLLLSARDLLFRISNIVIGVLLLVDAQRDALLVSTHMCLCFLKDKGVVKEDLLEATVDWKKNLAMNQQIVFGKEAMSLMAAQSKL